MASDDFHALVEIDLGQTIRLSQRSVRVSDSRAGKVYQYAGGLVLDRLPSIGEDDGECSVTVPRSAVDFMALRAKGIPAGGARCRVSILRDGDDYAERFPLLDGVVLPSSERYNQASTSLDLGAHEGTADKLFPPYRVSQLGIPGVDSGSVGNTLPILYGSCLDVQLIPVGIVDPSTLRIDLIVSGCPLVSRELLVRRDGVAVASLPGVGDPSPSVTVVTRPSPVGPYSVCATGTITGSTNFAADVLGVPGPDGNPICGLGDVVAHMIRSYSGLPFERVDWQRIERARPRLNRFVVASQFGGSQPEGLVSALKGRYESAFPILISWRGGRLGCDYMGYEDGPVARRLRFGADLIARRDPVTVDSDLYSSFAVKFDFRNLAQRFLGYAVADAGSSEACSYASTLAKRAGVLSGNVPYQELQVRDVNSAQAARAVLDSLAQRFAVQRGRVVYGMPTSTALTLPLYERYLITDRTWGWSDVPMRLDKIELSPGNLRVAWTHWSTFRALGR